MPKPPSANAIARCAQLYREYCALPHATRGTLQDYVGYRLMCSPSRAGEIVAAYHAKLTTEANVA